MSTINLKNVEKHLSNLENGLYISFSEIIQQFESYESENDSSGLNEFFIAYVVYSFFDSEHDNINYDYIVNHLSSYQLIIFKECSFNKMIRIDKGIEKLFYNIISKKLEIKSLDAAIIKLVNSDDPDLLLESLEKSNFPYDQILSLTVYCVKKGLTVNKKNILSAYDNLAYEDLSEEFLNEMREEIENLLSEVFK